MPAFVDDHDWEEVDEWDADFRKDVRWSVCRRCGSRYAQDDRTQALPSSCDRELVKGVMRS